MAQDNKALSKKRKAIQYAAMWGYYHHSVMHYAGTSPGHENERLSDFGPPPNVPNYTDCSGFARWCYLSAGAYDPGTWTGDQWGRGTEIVLAQLKVADLIFYGDPNAHNGHVAVFVGYGKIVDFGQEGGPFLQGWNKPHHGDVAGFRRYIP